MTLGSTLKYLRERVGISQIVLANKLHISRQSISSWENDRACPSMDNLILLSEIYSVSVDDLLKKNQELRGYLPDNTKEVIRFKQEIRQIYKELEKLNNDFNYMKKKVETNFVS